MTREQALKNIYAAISSVQGNLETHTVLQESYKTIVSLLNEKEPKEEKPKEKPNGKQKQATA